MRLPALISLRNELRRAIDLSVIQIELEKNKENLNILGNNCDMKFGLPINAIAARHSDTIKVLQNDVIEIQTIIDSVESDIQVLASKFFAKNYQTELQYSDAESIRNSRVMNLPDTTCELLKSRINLHSNWKYPALEIGCRDGEWTKHLVSSDPLYIADTHQEFLDTTTNGFSAEYQARLRKYLIDDFKISGLPLNQFNFIFSYNFFNYLSFDSIKQYLAQSIEWLRSGGVMLFTYNNADLPASAGLAEGYFMTYVPQSLLIPLCESMGFEVIATHDSEQNPSISWIEIRKPGALTTVKAHQTLGTIKYR